MFKLLTFIFCSYWTTHFNSESGANLGTCKYSIQFNSILYSDCQIHFSASTKHLINDKLPKQLHYTILLLHIS